MPPAIKRFSITTRGADKAARALDAVGGRGADARPAWPFLMTMFRLDEERRWNTEGFGQWDELAPATIARKARKRQDTAVMRATGALERSLTVTRGRGAVRRGSKLQMRFGSSVFYGRFHQGGKGEPQGVKRRVILAVSDQLERAIVESLKLWVSQGDMPRRRRM